MTYNYVFSNDQLNKLTAAYTVKNIVTNIGLSSSNELLAANIKFSITNDSSDIKKVLVNFDKALNETVISDLHGKVGVYLVAIRLPDGSISSSKDFVFIEHLINTASFNYTNSQTEAGFTRNSITLPSKTIVDGVSVSKSNTSHSKHSPKSNNYQPFTTIVAFLPRDL